MMLFLLQGRSPTIGGARGRVVTSMAGLLIPALWAGCMAVPREASEVGSKSSPQGPAVSPDQVALSGQYWKRSFMHEGESASERIASVFEKGGPPVDELTPGRRVAISEFAVEFVGVQFQKPFGHQPMIKPPLIPIPSPMLPVHLGMEVGGVGRRVTPMPEDDQLATSEALYAAFERYLSECGLVVVPREAIVASAARAKFKSQPAVNSSLSRFLNLVSTDTGVVMRTHTVAARGLGVATCGAAELAAAESQIKAETHADVLLAVRLRVGTYHKKAALEQQSVIRQLAATGSIILTSRKSLLSDGEVTDESHFRPVVGRIEPVHQGQFVHELEEVLPTFVGLAFPSLRNKVTLREVSAPETVSNTPLKPD